MNGVAMAPRARTNAFSKFIYTSTFSILQFEKLIQYGTTVIPILDMHGIL